MYVCMYVCICMLCMYVFMYVCIYVCMCNLHMYDRTCVRACVRRCLRVCVCMSLSNSGIAISEVRTKKSEL